MQQSSAEKEALFTSAPVGRAILSLAVPTVISQIITVVYNMADTFFIGQLGDPNQVAAATIAMPLFIFLTALANLFGIGGASLISRCLGVGNREKAGRCSAFCLWSAAGIAALYGLLVLLLLPSLLPILGANDQTRDFARRYLFWTVCLGSAPTVLNPAFAHLIRAEGYSRQASLGVAFGGILNIALDPLFIFVFRMQIEGAAIATMLSNIAACLYFLCLLRRLRGQVSIRVSPKYYTLSQRIPVEVLSVGLPSFLISTMAVISNTMLNRFIASYANEAVAGMGIAKRIDLLAFAVAQGMAQGTLPLIGYNFTSGNRPRMRSAIRTLLLYCILVSCTVAAGLYLAAGSVTKLFINDAATASYGALFLSIICLACPTTSLNIFVITVFQATGKKLPPIFLSLLRKGSLDVALMAILNRTEGIRGVAWASPIADAAALVISGVMLLCYLKRLNREPASD